MKKIALVALVIMVLSLLLIGPAQLLDPASRFAAEVGVLMTGTVEDTSKLRNLSTLFSSRVTRLSGRTRGDGAAFDYLASDAACTLNGGAGDGTLEIPSADGKCWVSAPPAAAYDIRQWDVATDGSDQTSRIQSALDSVCAVAKGRGTLIFPHGVYGINAATGVTIGCAGLHIEGSGYSDRDDVGGTLILVLGSGSAPIFNFTAPVHPGDRYFYGGSVRNLGAKWTATAPPSAQSGPFVRFLKCYGCTVDTIYASFAYRVLTVEAGFGNRIANSSLSQMALDGEAIRFQGSDKNCADIASCFSRGDLLKVENVHIDSQLALPGSGNVNTTCIRITDFAETTWIRNVTCNQAVIGIKIDCPTSATIIACPQFIHLERVEAEVNATNAAPHESAVLSASDFAALEAYSLQAYGSVRPDHLITLDAMRFTDGGDAQFYGGKVEGANSHCVRASVHRLRWFGGNIYGCNWGNVGGNGIDVTPNAGGVATSGSAMIQGVTFCDGYGRPVTVMGGLHLHSGTDYNSVVGNNFRNCKAAIADESGSHTIKANNILGP